MKENLIVINDNKFKSIFISVNFIRKLSKEENHKNALLASILRKGTSKLNSEEKIDLKLAELYASGIDTNVEKVGGFYNVEFGAEFINKKFINEDVSNDVLSILHDVIYSPYLENGAFGSKIFDTEKKALVERINQEKNDKRKWSLKRLESEMYNENDYGFSVYGDIDSIEKETNKSIFEYYKEFLKTSQIRIVITGNLDGYEDLEQKMEELFLKDENVKINELEIKNRNEFRNVEEYEPLNQSVLCMGLNVKNTDIDMIPEVTVYNSILGGTPASKLFQNVREKESLAYFAKSQYNRYINGIYIYSGINLSNVEKAKKVINEQLKDLKEGNITEEEIDTAKKNIILTYKAIRDNKVLYNRLVLANSIKYNKLLDLDDFINKINNVEISDVVKVAQDIDVNTVYLLGGKIDE